MKTQIRLLTLVAALFASIALPAVADGKDAHKHLVTPKGGKLLEKTEPHAEFVVEKDHTVTINFYDEKMKSVAATTQSVTVIADAKDGKATLQFKKKGDTLVSKTKLPEGKDYTLVVQFRQNSAAKPKNFRIKLDLSVCGECKRQEYACICHH